MNAADLAAELGTKLATYARNRFAALTIAPPSIDTPTSQLDVSQVRAEAASALSDFTRAHAEADADVWLMAAAIDAFEEDPAVRTANLLIWDEYGANDGGLYVISLHDFIDADGNVFDDGSIPVPDVARVAERSANYFEPIWQDIFTRPDYKTGEVDLAAAVAFVDALPQP